MTPEELVFDALQELAESVKRKMSQQTTGEPEDQLRAPFENFMKEVGISLSLDIESVGETKLDRIGKPDYAIHSAKMLAGHVELKATGTGANPRQFKGHNKDQWKRFKDMPNLIYTDGNEWGLYRSGEAIGRVARLSGDIAASGKKAVDPKDAQAVLRKLTDFLQWQPAIPTKAKGQVDLRAFANMLAPLCRMLRDDVTEALSDPRSPLVELAENWRQLLFPDADDEQFADAYAQTVTFALLLARSEGAILRPAISGPGTRTEQALTNAEAAMAADHSLLSRALQVLTDRNAQADISASLNLLIRVISQLTPAALRTPREAWLFRHEDTLPIAAPEDPWLYFYEDFLAAYDAKLRKDAGAYYTPVEVVLAQVRLVDDLLTNRLGKPMGFADPDVITLDPATGTGTYLLGVIDHALARAHNEEGKGAVPGRATALAKNIYGFELMAGPFAVSELRIARALQDWGAKLPKGGTNVYLTDTLESPHATPEQMGFWYKEIADQHAKALEVKVYVVSDNGNPRALN